MKRWTALLLSVLFLLTALPMGGLTVAAEEEYPYLQEGVPATAVIKGGAPAVFLFTPAESGYYAFYSSSDKDTYGYIYTFDGDYISSNDDGGEDCNFRVKAHLTAGVTYRLEARFYSEGGGSFPVCIEQVQPKVITDVEILDQSVLAYELEHLCLYMRVYYSDGTMVETRSDWIGDDLQEYYGQIMYGDQDPTQWTEGNTYTVKGYVWNQDEYDPVVFESDFTVTVMENPIASVEVKPITLVEYTNGYWDTDWVWDDEAEDYVPKEYYRYDIYPTATITMKNGEVFENTDCVYWNDSWYYFNISQNYENQLQWGTNTLSGSILHYEFTMEIEVTDSPIASVEVEPITVIENVGGYWNTEWVWDDELEEDVAQEYFYYHIYPTATVTMKDGTVYENVRDFEWEGRLYGIYIDQNYENRLQLGTNIATGSVLGYEYTVEIEVIDTPIASIEVDPVTVIEGVDGDWTYEEYWDEELGQWYEGEWFRYYVWPTATVTMKDGTVYYNVDGLTWGEDRHYFGIDQSLVNQLQLGTNTCTGSILGYDFTVEVTVAETPVASVSAEKLTFIQYDDADVCYDWIWDEETEEDTRLTYYYYYLEPESLTVTLKDGTVHHCPEYDMPSCYWFGSDYTLKIRTEQNYENWLDVGTHTIEATFMGVDFTYEVEIVPYEKQGGYDYVETEAGIIITDCFDSAVTLEIPATIDGKPVVGVADLGDGAKYTVKHLVLPDSVTTVGEYLLQNLQSVHFGAGVKNLTPEMFRYCYSLQSISVSASNPNYTVIDGVLYNKTADTLIAYPIECGNMEYVVPATVTNVNALTLSIYSWLNVTVDRNHAAMVTVDGVTYTKDMTRVLFCDKNKAGVYDMPDSVTSVADNAFAGCTQLTEVKVAPSVTTIVYGMFRDCESLQSVELPQGLVSIEPYAFCWAINLTSIDLPAGLTTIGDFAFEVTGLTEIDLPAGLTTIGNYAFAFTSLTTLVLPDSVRTVGGDAFYDTPLKSVDLGRGVRSLGDGVFACTNLTSVVVPDSVTYLGGWAFYRCNELTDVVLGAGVTVIGDDTFAGCPLESIDYRGPVTTIGQGAFIGNHLPTLNLPDSVTSIMYQAYSDSRALTDVTLPEGLMHLDTWFPDGPWYERDSNGVVCIDHVVFGGFESDAISLPEGTTLVRVGAYDGCHKLTKVEFSESMRYINYRAFAKDVNLTTVYFGSALERIDNQAFIYCYNLTDVYYAGTKADRDAIIIGEGNEWLLNATWHYNACPQDAHVYDNECDNSCNACGWVREDAPGHTYDSNCAAACNNCGVTRTPPHSYSDDCDGVCNGCGQTRTPLHIYDNAYDEDCNRCGAVREVPDYIFGDGNGDGKINVRDLGLLQQKLNGWDVTIADGAMDLNGDGKVNIRDLGLLQQYLNGWDVTLGK